MTVLTKEPDGADDLCCETLDTPTLEVRRWAASLALFLFLLSFFVGVIPVLITASCLPDPI